MMSRWLFTKRQRSNPKIVPVFSNKSKIKGSTISSKHPQSNSRGQGGEEEEKELYNNDAASVASFSSINSKQSLAVMPLAVRNFMAKQFMARNPRHLEFPTHIVYEAVKHPHPPPDVIERAKI
jgi:hypothetical protein